MQHDGQVDRLMSRQKEPQQPIEGIENPHLAIGQERRAHKEVRIPERQSPGPDRPRRLRPVGVEVGEHITTGQHPPCQRDLPEAGDHHYPEQDDSQKVTEETGD